MVDNRSEKTTGETGSIAYCRWYRDMRTPFNKLLVSTNTVDKDSPTALWILQLAHQTELYPDPTGKRVSFTDTFYTRHTLATDLKKMLMGKLV